MPLLFNCSAFDNIRIGRSGASDGEVFKAAKEANAYDFIENLPDGFDTIIGEQGNSLSGGQKQRIAIARALLKDAPIMIFDEATSALDEGLSKEMLDRLELIAKEKTLILITHDVCISQRINQKVYF